MNIAMVDDNQADLDKMKGALKEYAAQRGADITCLFFHDDIRDVFLTAHRVRRYRTAGYIQ